MHYFFVVRNRKKLTNCATVLYLGRKESQNNEKLRHEINVFDLLEIEKAS